jgi:hypothetical protein
VAAAPEPLQLFGANFECAPQADASGHMPASLQTVRRAARLVLQAQDRFLNAVLTARRDGCTWRQIGTAMGVPYQSLHRRFAEQATSETPGSKKQQG